MHIYREFNPCGRYTFDFDICSIDKGYAQLDVPGDAEYLGHWINPTSMKIVEYCEGDITIFTCDNKEELLNQVKEVARIFGHARIDPGLDKKFRQIFVEIGLEEFL